MQLPADARAALVIVTVDQTEGLGYLALYTADTPPSSTIIDWSETGDVIATSSTSTSTTSLQQHHRPGRQTSS